MGLYSSLQNGSDIRGVAIEGVAGEPVNLTETAARDLGRAFARWLSERTGKPFDKLTISIGRDSRLSGPALLRAAAQGIVCTGATVIDCSMASTPAMFMSTVLPRHGYDGAIMITASHLPFNRNGLKFFTSGGGLESADIKAIIALAEDGDDTCMQGVGQVLQADLIGDYASHLVQKIRAEIDDCDQYNQPLMGFRIAVDAGNGAGGFFASKVLEPLGADVSASAFLEPDGNFPNHVPNPEDPAAMASITGIVKENGCDLGLIFDTDVDRAAAVDASGEEINRNKLIALIASIALEDAPGGTIVTDSVTSSHLKNFIEGPLGGKHHRFKRGYKNVINEAIRLEGTGVSAPLAIETSGHGALKENYYLDDGAYLCAKIVARAAKLRTQGKTIADMLSDMREPADAVELRFTIGGDNFGAYGREVLAGLETYIAAQTGWQMEEPNYEGIRVISSTPGEDGWFLLRMSLHDPILPLNIETDDAGGCKKIAQKLLPFLKGFDRLDLSSIEAYLK